MIRTENLMSDTVRYKKLELAGDSFSILISSDPRLTGALVMRRCLTLQKIWTQKLTVTPNIKKLTMHLQSLQILSKISC
jgi:hypothetical protein